jgi:hypothetical protein
MDVDERSPLVRVDPSRANAYKSRLSSMRMVHYFSALAILVIPALVWTVWTGAMNSPTHLGVGLFSAVFTVAAHSLLILFMIVTGRVLKEAMIARPLGPKFLAELNVFFARRAAYPAALLAVLAIAVAAVLGFAPRAFGLSSAVHWIAGLAAVGVNLWAIPLEYRALRENQSLIDRAAIELDRIDRDAAASGTAVPEDGDPLVYDPQHSARWGLIVAISAWFPYLYWGLIVWKGDFARLPWGVHPWLEASLLGAVVYVIARRDKTTEPPTEAG